MLASFWSGLGGELAKHWAARIFTPAMAFWLGGLVAVWWHTNGDAVSANGWESELRRTAEPLDHLPGVVQGLLVIGALMLVATSALAAERLTLPVLRLLEGHWPWWFRRKNTSRRRRRRAEYRRRRDELNILQRRGPLTVVEYGELRRLESAPAQDPERLATLREKRSRGFTPRDAAELTRARAVVHNTPEDDAFAMPTRLGDILRAAERRPGEKYGLDAAVCWTALWLVMSSDARTEIAQARARLDGALRMSLWGALFLVWAPWTLWAIPIAIVVPIIAYYGGILGAAKLFGELIVTSFDLYRMQLYDAVHLPRPASPAEERRLGAQVTSLLWGGLDDPDARYVQVEAG